MGSIDISQLCRLCLVKEDVNIPIFEETSDLSQTFLKIKSCLPVKVSVDDSLPKKICDGCSYKLEMLYMFRKTSMDSEKTLNSWVDPTSVENHQDEEITVKQEYVEASDRIEAHLDDDDSNESSKKKCFDDPDYEEEPRPKRSKRAAAMKKPILETDDDELDDESLAQVMKITKAENNMDEDEEEEEDEDDVDQPDFSELPSTSADDQPGPSGLGKDSIEAPERTRRNRKTVQKRCTYNIEAMRLALDAVKNHGYSLGAAADRFKVPKSTLGKHYRKNKVVIGSGRRPEMSESDENTLVLFLQRYIALGVEFTKTKTLNFVTEFVKDMKMKTRWNKKGPGDAWFTNFLKRHPELTLRKGETLRIENAAFADPYNDLVKIFRDERITLADSELIYNCVELGFCHESNDVKIVAAEDLKACRTAHGSSKKHSTVLACCSANGHKMPPFVIFEGVKINSDWAPGHSYPGTIYTVQMNGWMEDYVFCQWFESLFLKNIPPTVARDKKIILIYNGAVTYLTYQVAKLAFDNHVILLGLSENIVPLNNAIFSPLKSTWAQILIDYQTENPGDVMTNKRFLKLVGKLWNMIFKPELIKQGFKAIGKLSLNEAEALNCDSIKIESQSNSEELTEYNEQDQIHPVEKKFSEETTENNVEFVGFTIKLENFIKDEYEQETF